jgi:pyruvate,water dikinase
MERAAPDTRDAFSTFLARHGHRSFTLDIAAPTFADDPSQVLRLLRGMESEGKAETGKPIPIAVPRSIPLRPIFNAVRGLAVKYVTLREDQRYYWQKSLAVSRRLYWVLAGRLVDEQVIGDRNEVFNSVHRELVDHFQGRLDGPALAASIRARQVEWEGYRRDHDRSPGGSYPLFLRGDAPLATARAQRPVWQARAVSPGMARGAARVVQSANDLALVQRGEILIAPSTDPAWTPVFSRIAGLVLERGGVLSHGAVVAREYRVPAVAGIANIAREIRDGDMIEVNGNTGVITRVEQ